MDPHDQSSWRRLPGPGESPAAGAGRGYRDRGLRHVRRLSNWTAVALVAATAATAGYFARGSPSTARPAAVVTNPLSTAAKPGQPCVTVPVATSGGSGVTTQVPVRTCAPGATGTRPIVIYVKSGERGD
jgi:hypothetical protein